MPESETVMAFDFGAKHIGVAIGESLLGTGRALATIAGERKDARFAAIARLIDAWRPARLIVGRPAHDDDPTRPHELTARCERFARQLSHRFRLPVELVDERYTSTAAAERMHAKGRKGRDDAEAAAILLEAWFHERQSAPAGR